ncbi:MAG: S9 family peptidase, partial [Calditrichia bacterium]|nr:S9 family peptidase [Calditrichia bacterium]
NKIQLIIGKIKDGSVKTVFIDEDEAWLDEVNDLKWLSKGKEFTWVSERDGWRHVYLVSRDGKKVKLLTKGNYDVISIEKIDDKGGWLYFIASPDNPTQRYLYRIKLNGKGKAQRLSPKNLQGTHEYQISYDAKWAIHTYSKFGYPEIIDLVSLPEHTIIRNLAPNTKTIAKIIALKKKPVEFFRINIEDGVELDGWMMKPYNFDKSKKYPVLFFVYGEPAGQRVLDRYPRYYPWHVMLTQQGYIVMSIDNRGTPAPRGREFRKCIYKKLGTLNTSDQAKAAMKIRKWSFVDSTRIGMWGWSGGGSVTLNAMFRYPEIYKTGLSIAPVPDQRYYDTIYQERYCGIPTTDAEVYKQGSPINFAQNLVGNLLIVHGTGDDNVHYQGTEALVNKLIENNKHFTMMSYPNRGHSIYEGDNTRRHLFNLLTTYLNENLPAGGK